MTRTNRRRIFLGEIEKEDLCLVRSLSPSQRIVKPVQLSFRKTWKTLMLESFKDALSLIPRQKGPKGNSIRVDSRESFSIIFKLTQIYSFP